MNLERAGVSLVRAAATVGVLLVGAAEARSQAGCTYTLSPGGGAVVQNTGGSGLVNVSAERACFWQSNSLVPWISAMGSGGGKGSVAYSVGANPTGTARTGGIEIADQMFTITQPGAPCTYSLTPASAAIGSAGGSGLVTLTALAGCPWQATSQAPWISTMGAGSGSGSLSFSVAPNPTGVARNGTIAVAGQTFSVTQAPLCTYSLSPTSAAAASGGGSATFNVSAPAACSWQAVSQASWIHVAGTGGASGSASVTYSVDANPAAASRSGSIVVAGQTLAVTQAAAPCTYTLLPTSAAAASGGGSATFKVRAPDACLWQAASQVSWIHVAGTGGGSGGANVTYSVDPNPAAAPRSGSIVVADLTLTVTQAAAPCTYSLSPTQAPVGSGGGGGTIAVSAPTGCPWQATSQASWISTASSGNGNGSAAYSVAPNFEGIHRNGLIVVAGQSFTVSQPAVLCTYSLSPTQAPIGSGGGGGTIAVTATSGCTWNATSQASWISTTGSGKGNGSVAYSVAPNIAGIPRSGAIVVAGQSFTVTQAAAPCTYGLSPIQAPVGSGGGGGTITVTAPIGCTWNAASQASWISTTSSGTGSGSVTYSVAANTVATTRSGAITVAGQSFTVTQAAAPCTYSLTPTQAPIGSAGGGGTITVTTPVGCTWNATSQVSWISTTSSGNGSGTVTYSVATNAAATERSGSIVVANQTFTVHQAAAPCTYAVSPTGIAVGASGVTGSLDVTAPVGCHWDAASPDPWISVSTAGTGSGTAAYSIGLNPHFNLRRGTITIAGQVVAVTQDPIVAGTDTLRAGERLSPGQAIGSGRTGLLYQGDNNLVLYQDGGQIWATGAGVGNPTDRFEMQADCNAVVYGRNGYVWASGTNGQGLSCYARVIEGDWFICSGTTRVFSARGGGTCPNDAMLRQGESLYPGQCRRSPSGQVRLCLQADGDLVIQQNGDTIWAAETAGSAGRATLQANGSLVVFNGGGNAVWETGDVSADLTGPAALLVLDEGDVAIDQEDNLDAAPQEYDGDCEIVLDSRAAGGQPGGIHDVMTITIDGQRPIIKSMQDDGQGCYGVTCNDEKIGDGCPPGGDQKEPYHDTRRTWNRRMPRRACEKCAEAYDRTIGYAYGLGDSNAAVTSCIKAAQDLPTGERMEGDPPHLVSIVKLWRILRAPALRLGREYGIPGQHGMSPEARCTAAIGPDGSRCNELALSDCPLVCGREDQQGRQGRLCTNCPSAPQCNCTPSTDCSQVQCGTFFDGCGMKSCPNRCAHGEECGADNQCCPPPPGNCGTAYSECSGREVPVGIGTCFADAQCQSNWCVPCDQDCGCCGDPTCLYALQLWCRAHGNDSSCCREPPI